MLNYVIKRLLGLIPTLFIVSVLVFLFVHMLPGDPARLIAGPEADAQVLKASPAQMPETRSPTPQWSYSIDPANDYARRRR